MKLIAGNKLAKQSLSQYLYLMTHIGSSLMTSGHNSLTAQIKAISHVINEGEPCNDLAKIYKGKDKWESNKNTSATISQQRLDFINDVDGTITEFTPTPELAKKGEWI